TTGVYRRHDTSGIPGDSARWFVRNHGAADGRATGWRALSTIPASQVSSSRAVIALAVPEEKSEPLCKSEGSLTLRLRHDGIFRFDGCSKSLGWSAASPLVGPRAKLQNRESPQVRRAGPIRTDRS